MTENVLINILPWLMWLYGIIMSFTLLRFSKVRWGILTGYIPWFIAIVFLIASY